jgi:hypothetical protein
MPEGGVPAAVRDWQVRVSQRVGLAPFHDLRWNEPGETTCFVAELSWDAYGALLLLAAHAGLGESLPEYMPADWATDAVLQEAAGRANDGIYSQVIKPNWWLPGQFESTITMAPPIGVDVVTIGSSFELVSELQQLNAATYGATPEMLSRWRSLDPVRQTASFQALAQHGLAAAFDMAAKARSAHLPLIADA